jgi:hypothetical protein
VRQVGAIVIVVIMHVDARAELAARLNRLGSKGEVALANALALALALQHLADLRPFCDWLGRARRHDRRASVPPALPARCAYLRLLTQAVGIQFDLDEAVAEARVAALDHGVTSAAFSRAAKPVERAMHRLTVEYSFVPQRPPHRELDYLRSGFAFALGVFLGDDASPTLMALALAAFGIDPPIRASSNPDALAEDIAARTVRYRAYWSTQRAVTRCLETTFFVVDATLQPGAPPPAAGPFLALGDGRSLLRRPAHVPPDARVSVRHRRGRTELVARSRDGCRVRTHLLASHVTVTNHGKKPKKKMA